MSYGTYKCTNKYGCSYSSSKYPKDFYNPQNCIVDNKVYKTPVDNIKLKGGISLPLKV